MMRALTIRQPWAWLIVQGYKTVENRTWATAHRGPLAIHAAQRVDETAIRVLARQYAEVGEPLSAEELADLHTTGAILGVVDLVDCTRNPQGADRQWWQPGCWAWVLRNPVEVEPLACTGRLGLWTVDLEIE